MELNQNGMQIKITTTNTSTSMGKNRHTKDRLYLSASEWKHVYGGKKDSHVIGYKGLPFDCCALTFAPFENPVCTRKGAVYDVLNILPYLAKHGVDPVSGSPLNRADLIQLHFHKNNAGKYHCPVLFKEFTNNSHIVAIATSGNVFSYEAVHELNIKAKNWNDLVSGEQFKRSDIITLQDPNDLKLREYSNFHHARSATEKTIHEERRKVEEAGSSSNKSVTLDPNTEKLLSEIKQKDKEERTSRKRPLPGMHSTNINGRGTNLATKSNQTSGQKLYTTGAQSGSLTSTSLDPVTEKEYAEESNSEAVRLIRWDRIRRRKEKGYLRMITTHGMMNFELHFDYFPRTCENFMTLAKTGYYDGVTFHRLIKGFMVQGGDPTGTGHGGSSMWGESFKDEFHPNWKHSARGVLAMANSGPNTNKSQFYITFKPCNHLDHKHTVFGRVVGGDETLDKIESVVTDSNEKPLEEIKILSFEILEDPLQVDADAMAAANDAQQQLDGPTEKRLRASAVVEGDPGIVKPGDSLFGKNLVQDDVADDSHDVVKVDGKWQVIAKPRSVHMAADSKVVESTTKPTENVVSRVAQKQQRPVVRKKKPPKGGFGDFSSW